MSWLASHWKQIAVIAASTVVFVAVTAATGGLGAPALVALASGGFASGAAGYSLDRILNGQKPTLGGALKAGAISTVVTVATAGVARVVAPLVSRAVTPAVAAAVPAVARPAVQSVVVGAAVGGPLAAGAQVAQNAASGRPLDEGVGTALATGTAIGALQSPLTRAIGNPIESAVRTARGGAPEPVPAPAPGPSGSSDQQPALIGMKDVIEGKKPLGDASGAQDGHPNGTGTTGGAGTPTGSAGTTGTGANETTPVATPERAPGSRALDRALGNDEEAPVRSRQTPELIAARRAVNGHALDELAKGTRDADPVAARNAAENKAHIERLLSDIDARRAEIEALGVDPDALKTSILYSDLGKNADYLNAHAQKVFPDLYNNPATQGLAKFRAFLLHEEPGIDLVQKMAREAGLPDDEVARIVDGIVGHNGPGTDGSWWAEQWKNQIANQPENANSPLVGKDYPLPSRQAAIHTFLDRIDQGRLTYGPDGYAGGPKKIMNDLLNQKQTLETAARNAITDNANRTLLQLDHLTQMFPDIAQLDFIQQGAQSVRGTADVMKNVTFTDGGTKAVVQTPEGPVVATDFTSFWAALAKVPPTAH